MDAQRFASISRRMQYARTPDDFDRLARELGDLAVRFPDDPDVPALGEQLAMVRRIWRGDRR